MTKISTIVNAAAALISFHGLATFNAVRGLDGKKVSPPSGNRFARMTKADAQWYLDGLAKGKFAGVTPFGAINILSAQAGIDWRTVRTAVTRVLALPDNKLGPWNESLANKSAAVAGLDYAATVLEAQGQ